MYYLYNFFKKLRIRRYVFLSFKPLICLIKKISRQKNKEIKNILVIRLDRLGDLILSLPAINALRQLYASAKITALVNPANVELLSLVKIVDEIIGYDKNKSSLIDVLRLALRLRKSNFDLSVDLCHGDTVKAALACFLAAIPQRIGYDVNIHGFLFTKALTIYDENVRHETDIALDVVRELGFDGHKPEIKINICSEDRVYIERLFTKWNISDNDLIIGFNVGVSSVNPLKAWPKGRFAQLGDWLCKHYGAKIIITGTLEEKRLAEEIRAQMLTRDKVFLAAGQTSIGQLCALIKRCHVFVSNNTGAMNVAVALGVPTVVINGPSSKRRWAPLDPIHVVISKNLPCSERDCGFCNRGDRACIETISVKEVLEGVELQLKKIGRYPE